MLLSKRALAFALLGYFVTFVFAFISSIVTGFDPMVTVTPPLAYCLAIVVFSTFISFVCSCLYFTYKKPKLKASLKEGFKFGLTLNVLGFLLDVIFIVPYLISVGNLGQFSQNYGQWYIYMVFLGVFAASSVAGYIIDKK